MKIKSGFHKLLNSRANQLKSKLSDVTNQGKNTIGHIAKEIESKTHVVESINNKKNKLSEDVVHFIKEHELDKKVNTLANNTDASLKSGISSFKESSAWKRTQSKFQNAEQVVSEKLSGIVNSEAIGDRAKSLGHKSINAYGVIRGAVKNYYAPESASELLTTTREELIYLNACILQISRGQSEKIAERFSKALISKAASVGAAGGLFALVSAFGAASTGTAIATLSGAAATNATLAWIGGIVGGGMAAGATITGGLSLLVGGLVYKTLSSDPRKIDDLTDKEKKIVESCGLIIAVIDDLFEQYSRSNHGIFLSKAETQGLLDGFLTPLSNMLNDEKAFILSQLDDKHHLLFQEHALNDFKGEVIDGFEYFIKYVADKQNPNHYVAPKRKYNPEPNQAPAFAIGGMMYALLNAYEIIETPDNNLAIEALRRMNKSWANLNDVELGNALSKYDHEALKGVANNAKGIYHELIYVRDFNLENGETHKAELFGATNHPGSDVRITNIETGDFRDVQLKALSDEYGIHHHYERYKDIELLATEEIASLVDDVESTGISNEEISEKMREVINELSENSCFDAAQNTAQMTVLISVIKSASDVLAGKATAAQAGISTIKNVTLSTSSTLLTAYLFS